MQLAASTMTSTRSAGRCVDLSFFEMLGNWSFGDFFKREAIRWAWEFVTDVLGVGIGDNIWVTVHVTDDEAAEIWHQDVGLPLSRIQRLDKDNFWEMGDTVRAGRRPSCSMISARTTALMAGQATRRPNPGSSVLEPGLHSVFPG